MLCGRSSGRRARAWEMAATNAGEYSCPNCRCTVLATRAKGTMRSRMERSVEGNGVSLHRQPCTTAAREYKSLQGP